MNEKETKSPAKSELENKSLRQKLGHPAGLPKLKFKRFCPGKSQGKESLKGQKKGAEKDYPIKFSSKKRNNNIKNKSNES